MRSNEVRGKLLVALALDGTVDKIHVPNRV
jgi:hypothetical protein